MKAIPLHSDVFRPLLAAWGLALLLSASACGDVVVSGWEQAETTDSFRVELPPYLHRTNELHDFAGLQYENDHKGVYVIGIQESQAKMSGIQLQYSLADYSDFVVNNVQSALDTTNIISVDTGMVNGLQARLTSLSGVVSSDQNPLNIYYKIGVYESLGFYYQVICWTSAQQQVRYEQDMLRILKSVSIGENIPQRAQK